MIDDGSAAPQLDLAARERGRVVDRLRSLPGPRLARAGADGRTPADAAFALAVWAADASADLEGQPRRPLPRLSDLLVGDQVAVTTGDLLAAAVRGGVAGTSVVADLLEQLVGLRRLL